MISKSEKSNTLEGIRGIAALIVVFWHSMLGFMPSGSGIFPQWPPEVSLRGSPVFLLLNGSASVVLFFVLSGFVLTASSLKAMNTEIIYRNVVKRWPRLAGPVLCAVLFSYLLFIDPARICYDFPLLCAMIWHGNRHAHALEFGLA